MEGKNVAILIVSIALVITTVGGLAWAAAGAPGAPEWMMPREGAMRHDAGTAAMHGHDSAMSAHGGTAVSMASDLYHPMHLTVRVGDTVTWTNDDDYMHTVTSDDRAGPLDSGEIQGGETWSYTFTEPGVYRYHCQPHAWDNGDGYEGMIATIVVE